jgi:transcriptional regulator with XRE-family HTH domain
MNARQLVAWNVRRLRVLRGISSETLAEEAGVDRSYVSRVERGIANPTIDVLERVAGRLGVEMAELFLIPAPDAEPPSALRGGRRKQPSS